MPLLCPLACPLLASALLPPCNSSLLFPPVFYGPLPLTHSLNFLSFFLFLSAVSLSLSLMAPLPVLLSTHLSSLLPPCLSLLRISSLSFAFPFCFFALLLTCLSLRCSLACVVLLSQFACSAFYNPSVTQPPPSPGPSHETCSCLVVGQTTTQNTRTRDVGCYTNTTGSVQCYITTTWEHATTKGSTRGTHSTVLTFSSISTGHTESAHPSSTFNY